MQGSRRLALGLSVVLALMAVFDLALGAPALRLNTDTGVVHVAAAAWGFFSAFSGKRASNLFRTAIGLLFFVDAFMQATRGLSYLSFDAMRGTLTPMDKPARYVACLPSAALGVFALVGGLVHANRDAKQNAGAPPESPSLTPPD